MNRLLCVVVLVAGLTACGSSAATDSVTIGVSGDEGTLTPYTHQTGYPGRNLVALVYDTLLERDADNELKPLLATGFTANADNTEFTVPLRPKVTWHDGESFTASDVAFSVEYYRQHPEGSSAPSIEDIERVTPAGDTVVFTLTGPDPDFPGRVLAGLRILPEHVWSTIATPKTATVEQAIGTGPYRLVRYTKDQGYELAANSDYAMGTPRLKTLKISIIPEQQTAIAALRTGEVSILSGTILEEQAAGLERQQDITVERGSSFTSTLLAFNNGRAPFDDPKVRAAISAAIDPDALIRTVLRGRGRPGSHGFWHPDAPGADQSLRHTYAVNRARTLLAEAGVTPMTATLLVQAGNPARIRAAELIRDALSAVGISVTVSPMAGDSVDAKVWPGLDVANGRDYDMTMWGWSSPVMLDPTSLAAMLDSDTSLGRLNITGTADPDLDQAAAALRDATTSAERASALLGMQRLVAEKVPFVTLYYPEDAFAYRSDVYSGWVYQEGQGLLNKMSVVDLAW